MSANRVQRLEGFKGWAWDEKAAAPWEYGFGYLTAYV